MPTRSRWQIRDRALDLSERPLVMGILNVTPDSFSDGGEFVELPAAVAQAEQMAAEGADLIDVGGESTRPGAAPVSVEEEIGRVVPVVATLVERLDLPISVDTTKSEVAREALAVGAHIVNDVSGLRFDARLAEVVAASGAGLVLMHLRGEPRTMQRDPRYDDLMSDIRTGLSEAVERARSGGVDAARLVLDPGIGFGKTFAHNWEVLARLAELRELGHPIVVGTSRKAFLRDRVGPERCDLAAATLTTSVAAWLYGARIVRVHDVRAHRVAADTIAPILARLS